MGEDGQLLLFFTYMKEVIRRKSSETVAPPTVTIGNYVYDGTTQGPTIVHNQENWEIVLIPV